jgi:hypothetical protein
MASTNRITTPPPDALLTLRVDDGTEVSTDTTIWLDVGAGYDLGDMDNTRQIPAQRCALIIDFADTTQSSGGDNITINLLLNTSASASGATTLQLRQLLTGDDGYSGRMVFPVDNEQDGTFYRYMGFQVDFASSGAATWGGYVVGGDQVGIG